MMMSTKDEVGVLKIKIIVRWVRCEEDTTPDRPDVVHVALVCFRWGEDIRGSNLLPLRKTTNRPADVNRLST